jgi:hypothetical protein
MCCNNERKTENTIGKLYLTPQNPSRLGSMILQILRRDLTQMGRLAGNEIDERVGVSSISLLSVYLQTNSHNSPVNGGSGVLYHPDRCNNTVHTTAEKYCFGCILCAYQLFSCTEPHVCSCPKKSRLVVQSRWHREERGKSCLRGFTTCA